MALTVFGNRIKQVVDKANAAAASFDVSGAASSGGFSKVEGIYLPDRNITIPTGSIVKYHVYADNLFESGRGALDTTAHTVARTTITATSTGGGTLTKIDFSGATATPIMIIDLGALDAQSAYNESRSFIRGLIGLTVDTTHDGCGTGACFIEGLDGVVDVATAPADIAPSLTGPAIYYRYLFLSSGTPTIELVTTAPTPFAVPAGNAMSKTGDTSRRLIGWAHVNASNNIVAHTDIDLGGGLMEYQYTAYIANWLAAGTQTTTYSAALTLVPFAPPIITTSIKGFVIPLLTSASEGTIEVSISIDGTNLSEYIALRGITGSTQALVMWLDVFRATPSLRYHAEGGTARSLTIHIKNVRFVR